MWRALRLFCAVRISFRAVSRVLQLLAKGGGLTPAPGPHTVIKGVTRLAIVRSDAAPRLRGLPLRAAPCRHGRLWRRESRLGLGTGTRLAVVACDAQPQQRVPVALPLDRVHGLGGAGAAAWTGDPLAAGLRRLIAPRGRPAASRTDGGSACHQAVTVLEEHGLASPCLDAISHAVAGRLTRSSHDPPTVATGVAAGGRGSGQLKQTLLTCVAPPKVHTTARLMHVPRCCPWAERVRTLAPPGGAQRGAT